MKKAGIGAVALVALAAALSPLAAWSADKIYEAKVGQAGTPVQYRWSEAFPPLLNKFGLDGVLALTGDGAIVEPGAKDRDEPVRFVEVNADGDPVKTRLYKITNYVEARVEYYQDGEIATAGLIPIFSNSDMQEIMGVVRAFMNPSSDTELERWAATLIYAYLEHTAQLMQMDPTIGSWNNSAYPAQIYLPEVGTGTKTSKAHKEWRLNKRPFMNGMARVEKLTRRAGRSDRGTAELQAGASFNRSQSSSSSNKIGGGGSASFSLGPIEIGGSADAETTSTSGSGSSFGQTQNQRLEQSAELSQGVESGKEISLAANTAYAFWSLWETKESTVSGTSEHAASIVELALNGAGEFHPTARIAVGGSTRSEKFIADFEDAQARDGLPK